MTNRSRVEEVMTRRVWVAAKDAKFKTIAFILRGYGVSALPVVDHERHVLGVVSAADLLHKLADPEPEEGYLLEDREHRLERRKSLGATAGDLMTEPAVTIRTGASIQEAAELMRHQRVKRLPVVDHEGRLVGLVSRVDLLGVYSAPDEWIRAEVLRLLHGEEFGFADIDARVRKGVVTLTGEVPHHSDIPRLTHAVRHCQGVVRVETELSFAHDDLPPLSAVMAQRL